MHLRCLRIAVSGVYLRRSLGVSLVVGSILNAINQYDVLTGGAALHLPKLLLTFCVPFCVATYGTYSALLGLQANERD